MRSLKDPQELRSSPRLPHTPCAAFPAAPALCGSHSDVPGLPHAVSQEHPAPLSVFPGRWTPLSAAPDGIRPVPFSTSGLSPPLFPDFASSSHRLLWRCQTPFSVHQLPCGEISGHPVPLSARRNPGFSPIGKPGDSVLFPAPPNFPVHRSALPFLKYSLLCCGAV